MDEQQTAGSNSVSSELERLRREVAVLQGVAKALRESEERLRLALEASRLGTWDYDLINGTLAWDPRCRAIFGFSAESLLSFEQAISAIHPDDLDQTLKVFNQALTSSRRYEVEKRIVWPDGSIRWVKTQGQVYFEGEGEERRAVRMTGVVQDITHQKEEEQTLRHSKQRLRLALEAGQMGIWHWGLGEKVVWSQRMCQLFAVSSADGVVTVADAYKRMHPEDLRENKRIMEELFKQGSEFRQECRVVHPNGQTSWLANIGRLFRDGEGKPLYMIGITFDITPRKRAEAERKGILDELLAERPQCQVREERLASKL